MTVSPMDRRHAEASVSLELASRLLEAAQGQPYSEWPRDGWQWPVQLGQCYADRAICNEHMYSPPALAAGLLSLAVRSVNKADPAGSDGSDEQARRLKVRSLPELPPPVAKTATCRLVRPAISLIRSPLDNCAACQIIRRLARPTSSLRSPLDNWPAKVERVGRVSTNEAQHKVQPCFQSYVGLHAKAGPILQFWPANRLLMPAPAGPWATTT